MKPHIWMRLGKWHCGIPKSDGIRVDFWPRGIGKTPREALQDFMKRKNGYGED